MAGLLQLSEWPKLLSRGLPQGQNMGVDRAGIWHRRAKALEKMLSVSEPVFLLPGKIEHQAPAAGCRWPMIWAMVCWLLRM